MNEVSIELLVWMPLLVEGSESGEEIPLLDSIPNLEGVCDRDGTLEEFLDDGFELFFKSSKGISSERGRIRGLLSRDLGVPERLLEPSRDLLLDGVLTGVLSLRPFEYLELLLELPLEDEEELESL